jgi:hypothetical protein
MITTSNHEGKKLPKGKGKERKLYISTIAAAAFLMMGGLTSLAFAQQPTNSNCWRTVTSQRATTEGDIGEHASANEQGTGPRQGLGNLAGHPSELGTLLASVDGLDATPCP